MYSLAWLPMQKGDRSYNWPGWNTAVVALEANPEIKPPIGKIKVYISNSGLVYNGLAAIMKDFINGVSSFNVYLLCMCSFNSSVQFIFLLQQHPT